MSFFFLEANCRCKQNSIYFGLSSGRNGNKMSNNSSNLFKLITRSWKCATNFFFFLNLFNNFIIELFFLEKQWKFGRNPFKSDAMNKCKLFNKTEYLLLLPTLTLESLCYSETMTELAFLFLVTCKLLKATEWKRRKRANNWCLQRLTCDKINIVLSSCRQRCELIDKYNVNSLFNSDAVRLISNLSTMFIQCRRFMRHMIKSNLLTFKTTNK